MQKDRVSIITPNYNSAKWLTGCFESIKNQSWQNWEWLIVDDASNDNSPELLKKLAFDDVRIKSFFLSENHGPAYARNIAIKHATGRYIAFIDSDDIWDKQKTELQINFMKQQNAPISYTAYFKINEDDDVIGRVDIPEKVNYKKLLLSNVIGCSTAIYDIKLCGRTLMPEIRKRQDHGLWLKILKFKRYAYGLNMPLVKYRILKTSVSNNKFEAAKYSWKLYREVEKLSLIKSVFVFINYMIRGFLKFLK